MTELELLDLRIRILTMMLEKKKEQYHEVTLHGSAEKRHELHRQCFDLLRVLDRLKKNREKLSGTT